MCVCVCVYTMMHMTHVEVKGQLEGFESPTMLVPGIRFWTSSSVTITLTHRATLVARASEDLRSAMPVQALPSVSFHAPW